jgi:transcriptional regulator with PAS, ATPase and Fis domain
MHVRTSKSARGSRRYRAGGIRPSAGREGSDTEDLSQTRPLEARRNNASRLPVVQVLGDGRSSEALSKPYFVTFEDALEIGRRPVAGSGGTCLALPDKLVSAQHCRISRAQPGSETFVLEDVGSRNGTFIDGARIADATALREGAVMFAGSQALVFRMATAAGLAALEREAAEPLGPIGTLSPALALAAAKLRALAHTPGEVFLAGESGVGKQVFARAVHDLVGRPGSFVVVQAVAHPPDRLERELFGGPPATSMTGRSDGARDRAGARLADAGREAGTEAGGRRSLLDMAHGGTLFIDEIEALPGDLQSRLLRLGRDWQLTPTASAAVTQIEVRIMAGTRHLSVQDRPEAKSPERGGGRDAWWESAPIVVPPLRERVEDIGRLAAHFLELSRPPGEAPARPIFEPDAWKALLLHRWPLNVRELARAMTEAHERSGGGTIGLGHLPDAIARSW